MTPRRRRRNPDARQPAAQRARLARTRGNRMRGMWSFESLKRAVAAGEIDTVVVAFADMAGQLVGKRFHAEHFVESAHDETHACCYLLGNDIDMEPVAGYAAAC